MKHRPAKHSCKLMLGLCALALLSGCASSLPKKAIVRTETVEVFVPVTVAVPEPFTKPCPQPRLPETVTVKAMADMIAMQDNSLTVCNAQLDDIRNLKLVEDDHN